MIDNSWESDLIPAQPGGQLVQAGQLANQIAKQGLFSDYRARRAANTIRRQNNDLALLAAFFYDAGLTPANLSSEELAESFINDPETWQAMTWGLVAAFIRWLLAAGYAIGSINGALTTVKVYSEMAAKAGALDSKELALIQAVHGFRRSEGVHVDELRENTRRSVRRNGTRANKKARAVSLSADQAAKLKAQPDSPQGRRDRLIMCLLLDHGLRVGELARLTVDCFKLKGGELTFYRPKVNRIQTHRLTPDTLAAARAYLANDAPALGPIWKRSRKGKGSRAAQPGGGLLTFQGMTGRAITERVNYLGAALGIVGLSAHDCRHYWATLAAKNTPIEILQEAGGWSSLAMPANYIERERIANEGVKLG